MSSEALHTETHTHTATLRVTGTTDRSHNFLTITPVHPTDRVECLSEDRRSKREIEGGDKKGIEC